MTYPDYPFQSRRVSIHGHQMHYLDEGDAAGEPIVMVHGNPSWSFYFRHVVGALRDRYRCIVPDHIGMGLSDKPSDKEYKYRLDQRVDDLEALLEHLQIKDNITLLVHDWGGMIAMTFATRHPDRIKRMIVTNTAAFRLPKTKPMPWQLIACRVPILGALLVRGFNGFCRYAVKHCVTAKPMNAELAAAYLGPYDSWANRLSVLRFVQDIPLNDNHPTYATILDTESKLELLKEIPMMICWGMKDFVFDHHFLDEWTLRFPDAEIYKFQNAGHYVLEDAGPEIIALIEHFLDKHPVATSTHTHTA